MPRAVGLVDNVDSDTSAADTFGDVLGDSSGDQQLFGTGGELHQFATSRGVEFSEDVVEHDDRFDPLAAHELDRPESQRQRERPRFSVRGETLGHLGPENNVDVVAVRTDKTDAALDLLGARLPKALE